MATRWSQPCVRGQGNSRGGGTTGACIRISYQDGEGHISSFQRYQEGMQRHKMRQSGVMGKTVYNYLKNPGFDSMGEFTDAWGNRSGLTGGWGVGRRTDIGYFGGTSIYVFKNTAASYAAVIQEVSLPAGTYTLSAYATTKGIPEESQKGAGLAVQTADGVMHRGTEYLTGTSDRDIDRS